MFRSSPPEVFLRKSVLEIYSKFTDHSCRSVISISYYHFIEITLRHECSPVNLLHIFGISFLKTTSGGLLIDVSFHYEKKKKYSRKYFISFQIPLMNLLSSSLCNYFCICVSLCIFFILICIRMYECICISCE